MSHPYASREYALAFADVARPLYLEEAGLWVLCRSIPGTDLEDSMGCYPVSPIDPAADWESAFGRLEAARIQSLVLVSDVLTQPAEADLREIFDPVVAFKTHHLVDFSCGDLKVSKHHRQGVRRARRACETRTIALENHMDAWCGLYEGLVAHRRIRGIQVFSQAHFEALADMNDLVTVGAFVGEDLVSAHLWLRHEHRVYSHLAASNENGYAVGAAYAVHDHALRLFAEQGARIVDLGGTGGTGDTRDGLESFKRGFSNRSERNWLCGKIIDTRGYDALCTRLGRTDDFFPAYRGA